MKLSQKKKKKRAGLGSWQDGSAGYKRLLQEPGSHLAEGEPMHQGTQRHSNNSNKYIFFAFFPVCFWIFETGFLCNCPDFALEFPL